MATIVTGGTPVFRVARVATPLVPQAKDARSSAPQIRVDITTDYATQSGGKLTGPC